VTDDGATGRQGKMRSQIGFTGFIVSRSTRIDSTDEQTIQACEIVVLSFHIPPGLSVLLEIPVDSATEPPVISTSFSYFYATTSCMSMLRIIVLAGAARSTNVHETSTYTSRALEYLGLHTEHVMGCRPTEAAQGIHRILCYSVSSLGLFVPLVAAPPLPLTQNWREEI
jgi:hypothetical protein